MSSRLRTILGKKFNNEDLVDALVELAKKFEGGFTSNCYREHAMMAQKIGRLEKKLAPLFEEADVFVSSWAARVGIKDVGDLARKLKKHSQIILSAHENYQKFKRGQPREPGRLALVKEIGRLLARAGIRLTDYHSSEESKEPSKDTNMGPFAYAVSHIFAALNVRVKNTRPHLRKAISELLWYDDFMMSVPAQGRRGYVSIREMLPAPKQARAPKIKKVPSRKIGDSRSGTRKRAGSSRGND